MCIALIALNQHPLYPLILLANRDEFDNRASLSAQFWQEHQEIYAGQDLNAGGTWLGVTANSYLALLTNYRDPQIHQSSLKSRGLLVKNYLMQNGAISPLAYLESITNDAAEYNGFNLIVGDGKDIYYYSNIEKKIIPLSKGVYGLSNHLLDSPWPKVEALKKAFQAKLAFLQQQQSRIAIERVLFPLLTDSSLAPDHLLPSTGVEPALERALSSIFIRIPEQHYGTYCSSLVLVDKRNNTYFSERIFQQGLFSSQSSSYLIRSPN